MIVSFRVDCHRIILASYEFPFQKGLDFLPWPNLFFEYAFSAEEILISCRMDMEAIISDSEK